MNAFTIIVTALVALVAVVLIGLHVWVYGGFLIASLGARKRLAMKGRVISLDEAKRRIGCGDGTIVIENPTLGWNVSRVWWAPHNAATPRPDVWPEEQICPNEDYLNYDHLIDENTGEASLVRPFIFSGRIGRFLIRNFKKSEHLYVFSGAVAYERTTKQRAEGGYGDAEESG